MESSVKERLEKYLNVRRISKAEFGRQVGVSNAYVSSIRSSLSPTVIRNIVLNYPDLNIDWLLTGEGVMTDSIEVSQDGSDSEDRLSRFKQAVKFLIDSRAIYNYSDLAKALGKQKSYISEVLSGKRELTEKIISELVIAFEYISLHWLLTGEGKMLCDIDEEDEVNETEKLWNLVDFLREQLKTKDAQIASLLQIIQAKE